MSLESEAYPGELAALRNRCRRQERELSLLRDRIFELLDGTRVEHVELGYDESGVVWGEAGVKDESEAGT